MGLFSSKSEPKNQIDATTDPEAVEVAHDAKLSELQDELAALDATVPPPAAPQASKPALNPSRTGTNLDRLRQRVLEESTHRENVPDLASMQVHPAAPAQAPIPTAEKPASQSSTTAPPEPARQAPPLAHTARPAVAAPEPAPKPAIPNLAPQPDPAGVPPKQAAELKAPALQAASSAPAPVPLKRPVTSVTQTETDAMQQEGFAPAMNAPLSSPTIAPTNTSPNSDAKDISSSALVEQALQPVPAPKPAETPRSPTQRSSTIPLKDISPPMQFRGAGSRIPNIVPHDATATESHPRAQTPAAEKDSSPLAESRVGSASGGVRPIRTFKDDIASVVTQKQTSLVSVIAAEEEKRGNEVVPQTQRSGLSPKAYFLLGISAALVVVGLATYVVLPLLRSNEPTVPISQVPSFIFTDSQDPIDITNRSRSEIINRLIAAKDGVRVRLGAITHLYLTETYVSSEGVSQVRLVRAPDFLSQIDARAPAYLVRAMEPTMMFGIHEYDGNQPFLIFKVNDYENAFAGMLEWEQYLNGDLAPLFGPLLLPVRRAPEESLAVEPTSTSTGSTTDVATPDVGYIFAPPFVDGVIRNIEVRIQHNEEGGVALIYGFLDKQTVVITTAEPTFNEIYTRATSRRF
jgi:hypothetical protein